MDKLIINFAPTGITSHKCDNASLPVSTAEIISDVREAVSAGISSVHLHARGPGGSPVWQKEYYESLIPGIREFAPELVISVSTSGRIFSSLECRSDVLKLTGQAKPDMASLTLSSMNFSRDASINQPSMIISLLEQMNDAGIKPELEVFDLGMINYANYLIEKGLLQPPYYFNLISGGIAGVQADLLQLGVMLNAMPSGSIVSLGGIGKRQLPACLTAAAFGYGVRIGLEDNLWLDAKREFSATNSALLARIHRIAADAGREICSSAELRAMLELLPGNGMYGTK